MLASKKRLRFFETHLRGALPPHDAVGSNSFN